MSRLDPPSKIVLAGAAGLVGQNLVIGLRERGFTNLVVLDKNEHNLGILAQLNPGVIAETADLASPGPWERHLAGASVLVMLQAQIGALDFDSFQRNNIESTRRLLAGVQREAIPYTVHISSSVVNSVADDMYTRTKRDQEALVVAAATHGVILRPTLMFGWFDRKHLGWLSRFMKRTPVFPIPGSGRYLRQPLYVRDFCNVIVSCIESGATGAFDITGREHIYYIDMIRAIRAAIGARTPIVRIPFGLFGALLRLWAIADRNPPFTVEQLHALVAGDEFEVIDWERIFGVTATPLQQALNETFRDPRYSRVALEF